MLRGVMHIQSESVIHHPVDAVFQAFRDRLSEVAEYLDDIREISVAERSEANNTVRLHNVWSSDKEVPNIAKAFIKPENLCWDDHATWYEDDRRSEWRIETRAFTEAVSCTGRTYLTPHEDGTKVVLTGELSIDITTVPGVPNFLAKKMAPQIEKFIVGLVAPNFVKTTEAISKLLDDRPACTS